MSPHDVPTEPDQVSGRMFLVFLAATVAAILASAVAVWLLGGQDAHGGGRTGPTPSAPTEINAITIQPFSAPAGLAAERVRAEQLDRLDRWEWTDRAHGKARMPFARAEALYLQSLATGGAP